MSKRRFHGLHQLHQVCLMVLVLSSVCLGGCMQGHYLCPLPHGRVGCMSQMAAYQGSLARVPVDVPLPPVMTSVQKTQDQQMEQKIEQPVWVAGYQDVAGHLIVGHAVMLGGQHG